MYQRSPTVGSRTIRSVNKMTLFVPKTCNQFISWPWHTLTHFHTLGFTLNLLLSAPMVFCRLLLPSSSAQASELGIFSQEQALDHIGLRIRAPQKRFGGSMRTARRGVTAADEARDVLATVVLSHVPVPSFNFRLKSIYIAYMVRVEDGRRKGRRKGECVGSWGGGRGVGGGVSRCLSRCPMASGVAHSLILAPCV